MAEQIKNDEEFEAELTAASDSISKEEKTLPKMNYIVLLKNKYTFNEKEIEQIDLSGLKDLTTIDAQELDKTMVRLNHQIVGYKFQDTVYCKHIAMRATGLSADFFNTLKWGDMEEIKSRIMLFFMLN